jgi:hypothetical protein
MPLTPRIETIPTLRTFTPARYILLNAQHMFANSTQHCLLGSLLTRPYTRLVSLACIVAADACVELITAVVLDGDDIEGRVPVSTLGCGGYVEAVDCGRGGI